LERTVRLLKGVEARSGKTKWKEQGNHPGRKRKMSELLIQISKMEQPPPPSKAVAKNQVRRKKMTLDCSSEKLVRQEKRKKIVRGPESSHQTRIIRCWGGASGGGCAEEGTMCCGTVKAAGRKNTWAIWFAEQRKRNKKEGGECEGERTASEGGGVKPKAGLGGGAGGRRRERVVRLGEGRGGLDVGKAGEGCSQCRGK